MQVLTEVTLPFACDIYGFVVYETKKKAGVGE
jgi:hypothetical protein